MPGRRAGGGASAGAAGAAVLRRWKAGGAGVDAAARVAVAAGRGAAAPAGRRGTCCCEAVRAQAAARRGLPRYALQRVCAYAAIRRTDGCGGARGDHPRHDEPDRGESSLRRACCCCCGSAAPCAAPDRPPAWCLRLPTHPFGAAIGAGESRTHARTHARTPIHTSLIIAGTDADIAERGFALPPPPPFNVDQTSAAAAS